MVLPGQQERRRVDGSRRRCRLGDGGKGVGGRLPERRHAAHAVLFVVTLWWWWSWSIFAVG